MIVTGTDVYNFRPGPSGWLDERGRFRVGQLPWRRSLAGKLHRALFPRPPLTVSAIDRERGVITMGPA